MFIRIGNLRIKIGSIGEYQKGNYSTNTEKYYLKLRVSNKERMIAFDTEKELDAMLLYLDTALKVAL